jgi:hypothetical protein
LREPRYAARCAGRARGARPEKAPPAQPRPDHGGELLVRIILATLALSLLSGCSATRLAYDNADVYLRWKIGGYFDVEGAQSDELDERIDDFMAWHRANALPKYVILAEDAARRITRGLTRQDVDWARDSAMAQAQESLLAGTERLAPMIDRFTPEQIKYFEKGIAEDNRKFARDYLRGSERERRERRAAQAVERLEDWVGKLTPAQVQRIRQFSERAPMTSDLRERDRRRLQADVIAIVRARQASERLGQRIAYWQAGRDPEHVAANERFHEEVVSLTLDLDRTLTPDQRARAAGQMRRYAQELRVLSARAGRAP